MPTNPVWKKQWQGQQLPVIKLAADYVWISDALARQPEGVSGAVRAVLREVLGTKGRKDLDALYVGKQPTVAELSPVRLIEGYENLLTALDLTVEHCKRRMGYEPVRADVIRTALWDGLIGRGVKAPARPLNVYVEVLKRPGASSKQIADETGLALGLIHGVRQKLGMLDSEYIRTLTKAEIRVALSKDLTQPEAAARLGVTQKTIAKVRADHGYELDHRQDRTTPEQRAIILDTSLSYAEAARKAAVTVTTVARHRADAGLAGTRPRLTQKQIKIAADLRLSGAEAARRAGISTSAVSRIRSGARKRKKSQE